MIEAQIRSSDAPFRTLLHLFVFGFVFLILDSTVLAWVDHYYFRPDLTLVLVIYLGLNLPLAAGGVLTGVCGLLTDVASGGPSGLFTFAYLVIFSLSQLLRQKLDPASSTYQILVVLALAAISEFLVWGMLFVLSDSFGRATGMGLPLIGRAVSVMITALISPALFWLFRQVHQAGETRSEEEG